jgi:hypothetical protein
MTIHQTEKQKPWYRHPWPWILMAGPFIVVVAGSITAYLAVASNDGLVDDDYYKQGMEVNKVTVRDQKALSLGLQADVMQSADGAQIRILLRGNPEIALPDRLKLRIVHPTRGGADQNVLLRADGGGLYSGKLGVLLSGRWHIALEDDASQWRLTGSWNVEKDASLHLPNDAKQEVGSSVNSNNPNSKGS